MARSHSEPLPCIREDAAEADKDHDNNDDDDDDDASTDAASTDAASSPVEEDTVDAVHVTVAVAHDGVDAVPTPYRSARAGVRVAGTPFLLQFASTTDDPQSATCYSLALPTGVQSRLAVTGCCPAAWAADATRQLKGEVAPPPEACLQSAVTAVVDVPATRPSQHDLKYTEAEVDVMKKQAAAETEARLEAQLQAQLEARLDEEKARLAALWRRDLEDAHKEAQEYKVSLDAACSRRDEFAEVLAGLEREHGELEAKHATVCKAADDTNMALQCAEAKVTAVVDEKAELQKKLLACMEDREQLDSKANGLEQSVQQLTLEVDALKASVSAKSAEVAEAQQATNAAKLLHDRTVEAYKAKMEEKRLAFMALKEELRVVSDAAAQSSTALTAVQTELREHTAKAAADVAAAAAKAAAAEQLAASHNTRAASLSEQLAATSTDAAAAHAQVRSLTARLESAESALAALKASAADAASAAQAQHDRAAKALETELRELKIKVYDLTSTNRTMVEEANGLKAEATKLKAQEAELLGYVATLQDQLGLDDA